MAMRPSVSYTPCAIYSREQTGDIFTLAQFEEGDLLSGTQNLLSETRDDTESGNKSNDNSAMPPLMSEEEMDKMSSGNAYNSEPMSMEMLKYIHDGNQSHLSVNRRE